MTTDLPPRAATQPHATTHHNVRREDPYHWLRAHNWQEVMHQPEALDAEIRAYLEAENQWFGSRFGDPAQPLADRIYSEIRGRIKEDDTGVPTPDGPFAYNMRMAEGEQYPILVRTPRDGGDEEVLLDCNAEAGDGYFGFGGGEHDFAHRLLAWSADRNGSEYYTIRVRDLESGPDLEDAVERTAGDATWALDSKGFYYTELDDNHRPFRVCRHEIGTPQSADRVIYTEPDPGFFVGVDMTLSRRFIVIDSHDHQTSEVRLIDAANPGDPVVVAERLTEREYEVEERDGTLYILTNAGDAEDFKIVTAPVDAPGADNWRDLVPHRPGVLILMSYVLQNHLVRLERENGLPRIVIRDLLSGDETEIAFDEEAYGLGVAPGYEFDTETLRFVYSSPTTPQQTFDYDIGTGARELRKEQEVPSGHNPDDYVTRRVHATAPDGETVPVTLLHHKSTPLDGTAPCLMFGYGAYGISMPAAFSVSVLSLVDRGMVHAVAHIRGGKDKGYRWYSAGRGELKTNTFTDFIAAGEHLVAENICAPDKLVAEGGSAGGMLMGAVANMRPDLFAGIVANVPFVDVLNTMLDETLPLTPPEWPEWGNPLASADAHELIRSYSPYDNVAAQAYPPMFVLAGLTDPRVTYWEPAKWVARLRATKTDDNALFLRTNMEAGHGGASGRFDRIKETALIYAFALWVTGTEEISI